MTAPLGRPPEGDGDVRCRCETPVPVEVFIISGTVGVPDCWQCDKCGRWIPSDAQTGT